jgi:hypothetical protein
MPTKEEPLVSAASGRRLPKGKRGGIELLLVHAVEHLGKQGEVVEVKRGYAYNFLLPQGLATIATEHHKRMVEKHRAKLEEIARERLAGLRAVLEELVRTSVTIEANANDEGHLYGSVGRSRKWACIRCVCGWRTRSRETSRSGWCRAAVTLSQNSPAVGRRAVCREAGR